MEIIEARNNGTVIVGIKGRVDASNAGALEQKLLGLIGGGEKQLLLDLAELDYISSAGLRVLLMAAKRLGSTKLGLASLQEQIREVLDIAGFSVLFQIYPTKDRALASLR